MAAQSAAQLAHKTYSELHIIHVRPRSVPLHPGHFAGPEVAEHRLHREQELLERKAQRILDAQVEEIEAAGGSVVQTHLGIGKPAEEILALGEELGAGLIVVGSRGWGRLRRALIGSVSDSVIRHAHCPVLVVRGEKTMQENQRPSTRPPLPEEASKEDEIHNIAHRRRFHDDPEEYTRKLSEQRVSLEDVRHLTLRYSHARPDKVELSVEYVGGRIKVFEVDRYLVERLLEELEDQGA